MKFRKGVIMVSFASNVTDNPRGRTKRENDERAKNANERNLAAARDGEPTSGSSDCYTVRSHSTCDWLPPLDYAQPWRTRTACNDVSSSEREGVHSSP